MSVGVKNVPLSFLYRELLDMNLQRMRQAVLEVTELFKHYCQKS